MKFIVTAVKMNCLGKLHWFKKTDMITMVREFPKIKIFVEDQQVAYVHNKELNSLKRIDLNKYSFQYASDLTQSHLAAKLYGDIKLFE